MNHAEWQRLQSEWVAFFPVQHQLVGSNMYQTSEDHMAWTYKCKQGVRSRSQTIFARAGTVAGEEVLQVCYLHRTEGWRSLPALPTNFPFDDIVELSLPEFSQFIIHLRLFELFIWMTIWIISLLLTEARHFGINTSYLKFLFVLGCARLSAQPLVKG